MNKFLFVAAMALTGTLGGCGYLDPADPEPIPPKPQIPPPDFFDPSDYVKHGAPRPGTYRLIGVDASSDPDSSELVVIQSVAMVKGTDGIERPVPSTVSEKVRLAGIILPPKGTRGRDSAVHAINGWARDSKGLKNDLIVEEDTQYPTDLNGHLNVQIYFKGTGKETEGKLLNLNRMLVRSGYAVVDLHQATSIDHAKWFNDEQYARLRRDPKDQSKLAPLGLWKLGIILGQRPPVPGTKKIAVLAPGADGKAGITAPIGGTVVTKTTKKTTVVTMP